MPISRSATRVAGGFAGRRAVTPPAEEGYLRTIYVNNSTGDDSRTITEAQNPSTPFATIGRATRGSTTWASPNAAQAAIAGDLVSVAYTGNPYNEVGYRGADASLWKSSVMLQCANSGTSTDPITIKGSGGRPAIRAATADDRGGAIGCSGVSNAYIIWDSLTIDDTYLGSGSDFGPVVLNGCSYVTVQNCEIIGHNGSYYWGHATYDANYRGVTLEGANFCTLRNNKIHRISGGQNEGGVLAYDSNDNVIEGNTIWDCGVGVFFKGIHYDALDRNIIRRNHVYGCYQSCIRFLDGDDGQVYQNIMETAAGGDGVMYFHGWAAPADVRVFNNVFYGGGRTNEMGGNAAGALFYNNIALNCTNFMYNYSDFAASQFTADRNCFHTITTMMASEGSVSASDFAAWQALGKDTNGISDDPEFTDAANGDFTLSGTSPCLTLGRDYFGTFGGDSSTVIPAGAYVTGTEQIGADW